MMHPSTAALTSIVSFDARRIVIPEVEIKLDRCQENGVRMLLAMPDDELLQLTSTSPEHEDQGYARGVFLTNLTKSTISCRSAVKPSTQQPKVFSAFD